MGLLQFYLINTPLYSHKMHHPADIISLLGLYQHSGIHQHLTAKHPVGALQLIDCVNIQTLKTDFPASYVGPCQHLNISHHSLALVFCGNLPTVIQVIFLPGSDSIILTLPDKMIVLMV